MHDLLCISYIMLGTESSLPDFGLLLWSSLVFCLTALFQKQLCLPSMSLICGHGLAFIALDGIVLLLRKFHILP